MNKTPDHVFSIIEDLRNVSSTLEKQRILESHKECILLRSVFNYTENPRFNYYLRIKPEDWNNIAGGGNELSLNILDNLIMNLDNRIVTGNTARELVDDVLSKLTKQSRSLLIRVINRDLDCKAGTSICNKVWKDLIPEMPCMLASKMDEKAAERIKYAKDGYVVQRKCDGGRAMVVVSDVGGVTFLSRNGKPIETHGVFDEQFSKYPGTVFDGEVLVKSETGVEDRKTGNGFFTKAVRGTIKPEEAIKFSYVVWDMIPLDDFNAGHCSIAYKKRMLDLLEASVKFTPGRVSIVESKVVSSLEEAQTFYEEMLELGEEGAIIKFIDSPWENKRSKFMIKLKEEKDCDALVIGVTPHKKQPGWIGSLTCQTSDGKVLFDVGSGLTDEDRQKDAKVYLDKIVEVKYNSLITSKGKDTYSLFLPVFVKVRYDKTKANSFKELK